MKKLLILIAIASNLSLAQEKSSSHTSTRITEYLKQIETDLAIVCTLIDFQQADTNALNANIADLQRQKETFESGSSAFKFCKILLNEPIDLNNISITQNILRNTLELAKIILPSTQKTECIFLLAPTFIENDKFNANVLSIFLDYLINLLDRDIENIDLLIYTKRQTLEFIEECKNINPEQLALRISKLINIINLTKLLGMDWTNR